MLPPLTPTIFIFHGELPGKDRHRLLEENFVKMSGKVAQRGAHVLVHKWTLELNNNKYDLYINDKK